MVITPHKTDTRSDRDEALRHDESARRKLAPLVQWSEMDMSEHFVQFYETDEFLLDSVSGFIGAGLGAGAACIVIATKAHREGLEERLRAITLLQQKAISLEAEIAERQAAEERLRISENRYRRLFEASTDGILMVEPRSGLITDANPSFLHLLGSTREQVVDRELWQVGLLPDQPTQHAFLRQVQQDRVLRSVMRELATTGGDPRYVEWVSTLFQANGHEVLQ